ncbi:L-type lectin-domain containing receptor kinase IX.1-like [Gossypium australe]|uniref:L-type lectin-domain containing receptor kinase IX.1-like n=1 Tax=Gossypium australe TaxID=47621 RepID=A0A5B6VXD3_9ROSI|nr:L-type lectin-domain containing receptor kinase IX.1-like [Gossypium australe]
MLKEKRDRFGLGFKPDVRQRRKDIEKKQERRRARLTGEDVQWESMIFPHISQTFVSGGIIHPEGGLLESPHINAIHEEGMEQRNLMGICPYEPGSVLDNWTAEELPQIFFHSFDFLISFQILHSYHVNIYPQIHLYILSYPLQALDINVMSNDNTDSEVHFEQDMCLEESRDFEDDQDCDLSPDLLRMVKQEEKQILPHEEEVENIALEEGKVVKIRMRIAKEKKQDLVELL